MVRGCHAGLVALLLVAAVTVLADAAKPKVIVMTDGEIDDRSSMIRFLLYTCDVDLKAIIETNSMFQRRGHSSDDWYERQLDAYERIYPNLAAHRSGCPTADEIRAVSYVGDEDEAHLAGIGRRPQRPGQDVELSPEGWPDTPGSDRIVEVLLEDDPAPVHIQAWGGGNTAARAFAKLKRDHPGDYERAVAKAVMFNIWYQDDAGNFIETHHPGVTMIYCGAFAGTWNYHSQRDTFDFIRDHVKTATVRSVPCIRRTTSARATRRRSSTSCRTGYATPSTPASAAGAGATSAWRGLPTSTGMRATTVTRGRRLSVGSTMPTRTSRRAWTGRPAPISTLRTTRPMCTSTPTST